MEIHGRKEGGGYCCQVPRLHLACWWGAEEHHFSFCSCGLLPATPTPSCIPAAASLSHSNLLASKETQNFPSELFMSSSPLTSPCCQLWGNRTKAVLSLRAV